MTELQKLLQSFRDAAQSPREQGTYFEELMVIYLRYEASYKDLYSDIWAYADWAKEQGIDGNDDGIDLVAKTHGTNEFHAIQCKFYAEDYRVQKSDIDSFFTASGKKPFTHRVIVTTSNNWSSNAENSLIGQQPEVSTIDMHDLENSQIDWSQFQSNQEPVLKPKHGLRPHQDIALNEVMQKLQDADRGKLIMACGTGKTFTSLKIAEAMAGKGKRVLFLVPSLSLLSQTLTEWTQQSVTPLHSFAVCSDSDIGKKRKKDDDVVQTFTHELRYPATTNAESLAREMDKRHDTGHMSVVFSTYHSIAVISEAQQEYGLSDFDLVICDEAHRTTGATHSDEDDSKFVRVHDNDFLKAAKRLYMTATPRIYGDSAKASAIKDDAALYSMDDEAYFGEELYVISFSEAVSRGLLVDYKVIVLTVDAAHISTRLQSLLADDNNQLKVDDAAKIIGCWKALSKQEQDAALDDTNPMQRAVAFCQVIEASTARTHKVSSKNIASMFQTVVEAYQEQDDEHNTLACEAEHVDGSMNATEKESKLAWLKEETPENTCRILSNVRCLSEGVDVPALDAVLFLTPRNSQVDVVQSVGRIMRKAEGKERGYVILPVVIPSGVEPHKALDDNKTYKVVWEVLQALRSHDDRFDAHINKLDLIGKDNNKMEVIAITDKLQKKTRTTDKTNNGQAGKGQYGIGEAEQKYQEDTQLAMAFEVGEIERALYAKVVKKCGNRLHWEEWAKDIADIAKTHITRITTIVSNPENTREVEAFTHFADELRDDLNDSITNDEVIEMLAQHLITKPVFDALFKEYSFASHNPVSQAMQHVLEVLQEHRLDKEADTLQKFYDSVEMKATGIHSAEGKQKIVIELYDKFFRHAFPRMTQRLGIVYTPVEVVDFIIHSVNDVLKSEFGQTLGSEGVHIIDPFTGTGTFITRMLQSGLISKEQLPHKYKHEIHANEIVLLAYYIAAINIEAVYHGIVGGEYQPFEGICLTDTFQLYEKDDLISNLLADNSDRRNRQKELDIRVIMGNPPYSAGAKNENDNAGKVFYPHLDERIRTTYAADSNASLSKSLYDSYIRSIRWGSDRLGKGGVLAYVSNASYLDSSSTDGLRKHLKEEFSSLYVFHLRGNQRTSGELSRQEGGKIFDSGSRAPIAISVMVKNPNATSHGNIYFHDIGDYLSRKEKLNIIANYASIKGIKTANKWETIIPDKHYDWLNQRDNSFDALFPLGGKSDESSEVIFENYSQGILTSRDAWCYNPSHKQVTNNMTHMIAFYNEQLDHWQNHLHENESLHRLKKNDKVKVLESLIDNDATKISWSGNLKGAAATQKRYELSTSDIVVSMYRPFTKQWLYYNRAFNERVYQMPQVFANSETVNKVIMITGIGITRGFTSLMVDNVPNYHTMDTGQHFPLKLYDKNEPSDTNDLFARQESGYTVRDGITDEALQHFAEAYPHATLTKQDIFYYIYGVLHSPDYRTRYADNLSKQLPRIPCVKKEDDFWAFVRSGRKLGALHVEYETVEPYAATIEGNPSENTHYYVTKMKHGKSGKEKDKSTIIYNDHITIKDIPLQAYDYVVNGKAAIEWVMERQCVKTDKASGIVNDANDYATETVGNAKYPLELLLRVITVSIETMKIVNALPALDIDISEIDNAA